MFPRRSSSRLLPPYTIGAALLCAVACGAPQEAQQVQVVIETDAGELQRVTTNMGYTVQLTEARMMVEDLTFATGGELLTQHFLHHAYDWFIPSAHAHAGHNEGGDVTGELPGRLLLNYLPGGQTQVGVATLLVGDYRSANMTFSRATAADLGKVDDPLLGHTAIFRGSAIRDGSTVEFEALVTVEHDTTMMGIPFEAHITETTMQRLRLQLRMQDEVEDETLFDDLDFAQLDADEDGRVTISPEQTSPMEAQAHATLRDALLVHDQYAIELAK
jgi:hypothetical protein